LCLICPFDIFLNNIDEFLFRGTDFALWVILFGVGLTGAVCAILLPLRGKAFDVTYAVFFSLTLMFFMQGNYLNFGLNSLEGDGVGEVANRLPMTVINAAVWIVVVAGCILTVLFLKKQYREWIRTVGIIAMVTIIGMQLIPLAVGVLTMEEPDIEETKEIDSVLTYENFNAVGTDRNVFYFVVDRFDYSFYEDYALIVEDGKVQELIKQEELDETKYSYVRDFQNSVITPGFVNLHNHLQYSDLKSTNKNTLKANFKKLYTSFKKSYFLAGISKKSFIYRLSNLLINDFLEMPAKK